MFMLHLSFNNHILRHTCNYSESPQVNGQKHRFIYVIFLFLINLIYYILFQIQIDKHAVYSFLFVGIGNLR